MTVVTSPGLRERKKDATREALHRAAVKLAIAHGFEHVTVEAVADEAGVSRRTFSNYFANKEGALLYGDRQRMRVLVDIVRSRPADEPAWTALTCAAADFYHRFGDLDPEAVARNRLVKRHSALVAQQVRTFTELERELAAEIATRSGDGGGVRARLTAAVFLAALRVALGVWLDRPTGTSLSELVNESLTEAGRGFAE
jgi:AcrR family transcriptional regulator